MPMEVIWFLAQENINSQLRMTSNLSVLLTRSYLLVPLIRGEQKLLLYCINVTDIYQ